jgi:hypothetical protein
VLGTRRPGPARLKSEDVDTLVSAVDPGALAGVVSALVLTRLHALRGYDAGQLLPRPLDLATASASIEPRYFVTRVSADGTSFVPDQPLTRRGQSFAS